jgi:hypothetical protein
MALQAGGSAGHYSEDIQYTPTGSHRADGAESGGENMHLRKVALVEIGDALWLYPEVLARSKSFETSPKRRLAHHKPIGLLNARRYFDPLALMVQHAQAEGMTTASTRNCLYKQNH